jgi:hypothetical protein
MLQATTKNLWWDPVNAAKTLKECQSIAKKMEDNPDDNPHGLKDSWKCVKYRIAK